jgi:hypothetical protein
VLGLPRPKRVAGESRLRSGGDPWAAAEGERLLG